MTVYSAWMLRRLVLSFVWLTMSCQPRTSEPNAPDMSRLGSARTERLCNPSDLQRCTAANGCDGVRVCLRSGLSYGQCICQDASESPQRSESASKPRASDVRPVPSSAMASPSVPVTPAANQSNDLRMALYDQPQPQECDRDDDCAGGRCIQIGTTIRQCEDGSHCTLDWITPPPSEIPRWQATSFASYTGTYTTDVVHSRIAEAIKGDSGTMYRLENNQFWMNDLALSGPSPSAGDDCWIVPGRALYNLFVEGVDQPIGVRQITVVLDTEVVSSSGNLSQHGIYQLRSAGYWRVFSESRANSRRVLLATPNNRNYWIFTEGSAENPVDPALVQADSTITRADSMGFSLADGQAWSYFATPSLAPSAGDHVIIYEQALVDDDQPALPILDTTWIEGKTRGELNLVVPAR